MRGERRRSDVVGLFCEPSSKPLRTLPNLLQFGVAEWGIAGGGLLQKLCVGFFRHAVPLDQLAGKAAHGAVSLPLGNVAASVLQQQPVFDVEAALSPEDFPRSPKEKPCRIEGVSVEERQGFVNAKLHRLVRGSIRAGSGREEYMKPRASRELALCLHMVAAVGGSKGNVWQPLCKGFRREPVARVVGVVVVAVHRENIRELKVRLFPNAVGILGTNVVVGSGFPEVCGGGNGSRIRVTNVSCVFTAVRRIKGKVHKRYLL